jgi:hypothetical protein
MPLLRRTALVNILGMKTLRVTAAILLVGFFISRPAHAEEEQRPQAEETPVAAPVVPATTAAKGKGHAPAKKANHQVTASKQRSLRIQGEDVELAPAPLMIHKP